MKWIVIFINLTVVFLFLGLRQYAHTFAGAGWCALAIPLGFLGVAVAFLPFQKASRTSFARYLYARLGPGGPGRCLGQMFSRAFGASNFTRFWRHWNPCRGYFLAYFCFARLRRFAPRPLCLIVTFALNGVLHDLVYLWPFGFARTERLPFGGVKSSV